MKYQIIKTFSCGFSGKEKGWLIVEEKTQTVVGYTLGYVTKRSAMIAVKEMKGLKCQS